jgi:hypothetical protein
VRFIKVRKGGYVPMRKFVASLLIALAVTTASASVVLAERVRGYYRSNGTYVSGYNRSSANSTVSDNYSFKGNTNPYTGQVWTNYYRNDSSSPYYGMSSSRGSSSWNYSSWDQD